MTAPVPARRALVWMLAMCAVGASIAATMLIAIVSTEILPVARAISHLQQSFDEGSLQDEDWLTKDRIRGFNQYSDCLLAMMIPFRSSPWSSAVAPVIIFNDYPDPLLDAEGARISECAIARAAVSSESPNQLFKPERYYPYGRYIHAYRVPFNVLIRLTDVGTIRAAYRIIAVALLLGTFAGQIMRLGPALRGPDTGRAVAAFCFAGIAVAFLLFSGLDLFAQSLTHGPSDILLFTAFAWLSSRPPVPLVRGEAEAAALGALAFAFDFMHGTVPMMLAIIIGCAGLRAFGSGTPVRSFTIVRLVSAFVLGVTAAAATKLLALLTVGGSKAVGGYFSHLTYRMSGEAHTLVEVMQALLASTHMIAWGYGLVATLAVLFGIAFASFALARLLLGAIAPRQCVAVLAALASIAVIFVWYMVFRNHTAIHGAFMVRLLVWPIGMGSACLVLALAPRGVRSADFPEERPSQHSSWNLL